MPFFRHAALPMFLAFLIFQKAEGQNLVPNPSFEDVNTCAEFNQPCSPSAWFYLSRKLTTGYFPRFPSATGYRHLQIMAASRETVNRQYWETMLLCPVQTGERYTVSLKVAAPGVARVADNKPTLATKCPNLRDIGLWFTTKFVFVQGDSILQPRSWLSFTNATTKDLKNGWFEITKEYTATANASILVVGNFARLSNTDILDQRGFANPGPSNPTIPVPSIDILVDDLSVVPVKPQSCPGFQKVKDSLYAITWRHSDDTPREDAQLTHPPEYRAPVQTPDPFTDSLQRIKTDPPTEPLFGPEPNRSIVPSGRDSVSRKSDTLIIHNIQFDFDKYLVQNPDTLQRYRSLLTRPGVKKIQVVGFTDDIGSQAYNQDLSEKRAREIARLLSSKFNIPAALIEAEGRGISRDYPTKELNRRVEIYIFHE